MPGKHFRSTALSIQRFLLFTSGGSSGGFRVAPQRNLAPATGTLGVVLVKADKGGTGGDLVDDSAHADKMLQFQVMFTF
jgi:hypothetical protein